MPDGDWYMVNEPKKKLLYDNYMLDVQTWPMWFEHFPEIRLRKHCRFTKCEFCVSHRANTESTKSASIAYALAKTQMRKHYT
jgi:hypothetical protein